jgi:hypothetical protein
MKLYEKIIDGKYHCKPANKIVIIKDDMQIINPTEEMLFEDGWAEHISDVYVPTEEDMLNMEKEYKIREILEYDASSEVNEFFLGETSIWLDKATRAGLKLRFEAEISMGKDNTTLWYDNIQYSLGLNKATQMLLAIELYASACYDNTQAHIANVKALENIEDIKNYDYLTGYPEKLRF